VYLRTLNEPLRIAAGIPPGELFPLLHVGQIAPFLRLLKIELGREAATIIMLAAVAGAAGTRWLPAFALVFGVWDLTFYTGLKMLIDWPESLFTWDLLFLLPVPWVGPVLAPSIVAASLVIGGILGITRPVRDSAMAGTLLVAGALVIILSFTWDWRFLVNGGVPHTFHWWMFALGEGLGVAGLVRGLGAADKR
jgi:hypothetical protein